MRENFHGWKFSKVRLELSDALVLELQSKQNTETRCGITPRFFVTVWSKFRRWTGKGEGEVFSVCSRKDEGTITVCSRNKGYNWMKIHLNGRKMDENGKFAGIGQNLCNLYMCRKNDHFFVQNDKRRFLRKQA